MTPHIITDQAITCVVNGKSLSVPRGHAQADAILEAIHLEEPPEVIEKLFDTATQVEEFSSGNVKVVGDSVFYNGEEINGLVVDRILEFMQKGWPAQPLIRFLENLMANPSGASVRQLYVFLERCGLTICDDGHFLAYKGIQDNYWSCTGGSRSKVLIGQTNDRGQILNEVGAIIEVQRNYVQDDPSVGCSHGLHAGTWEYADNFGCRTVLVKINPKDVVSVPNDCNFEKLRTCRYEVVKDCGARLTKNYAAEAYTHSKHECPECGADTDYDPYDDDDDCW